MNDYVVTIGLTSTTFKSKVFKAKDEDGARVQAEADSENWADCSLAIDHIDDIGYAVEAVRQLVVDEVAMEG